MPRGVTHKYPPDDEIVRLAATVTDKRALSRKLGIPDPTFYGFLSRNPDLQKRVEDALIVSVVEPTDDRDPLDAEIHGMLEPALRTGEHDLIDRYDRSMRVLTRLLQGWSEYHRSSA